MVGKYSIEVSNNRVTFRLEVKRNITVIQGDSATGKTTLIRMISEYNRAGNSSGISIKCEKDCIALSVADWEQYLTSSEEKIIFLDENNSYIHSKRFAELVKGSDNYFVLIIRDSLPRLAYSVEEIYGMRESRDSQKYMKPRHVYNEIFKLYNIREHEHIKPEAVITEDSNAGHECFSELFECECIPAGGKSLVVAEVLNAGLDGKDILAIVDGAAFGADIAEFLRVARNRKARCVLYAPESFEFLILQSGIVQVDRRVLEETQDYADSRTYESWEQFFTAYLIELSEDTIYKYSKSKLNKAYLTKGNIEKIKKVIPNLIEISP